MMSDFPDFRQGETWSEQSASKWRNLVDAVAQINALAVGPGLILNKSNQGWDLNLAPKPPVRIPPPSKSVVLVEAPSEAEAGRPWLMVREVEYATPGRLTEPPDDRDHPYRWRGVTFQAYPQIGRTPADYSGSLWDEQDAPTLEATFLTATFDGSAWILDLPVAGEPAIAVVLVEAPDESGSILKIRKVKYEAEPPVAEQYAWDGDEFDAYPAFGLTVGDFVGLEWTSVAAPEFDGATFLKARLVDGAWLLDKPGGLLVVAQFKFVAMRDNYFLARSFDGSTTGTETIKIAKPYLLRETTYDGRTRDGIFYTSTEPSHRQARKVGADPPETEAQVIIAPYLANDLIYATAHVRGGIDVFAAGIERLLWLDDNRDGRAWAAEFAESSA